VQSAAFRLFFDRFFSRLINYLGNNECQATIPEAGACESTVTLTRVKSFTPTVCGPSAEQVPIRWRGEVQHVLISEEQIARRIRKMSRDIVRDFSGREMVVVSLLNGTVLFLADLIRNLSLPLRLDFIGISSYGNGTQSGELVVTKELRLDVEGRDVLLVDDILDTGKTLVRVQKMLTALNPRRIKICVLLKKEARRINLIEADYVGFEIPDVFVVGYGLDFAERFRNLPFLGVLKPGVYQNPVPTELVSKRNRLSDS